MRILQLTKRITFDIIIKRSDRADCKVHERLDFDKPKAQELVRYCKSWYLDFSATY